MSARQARIARKQRQRDGLEVYIHETPDRRTRTITRGHPRRELRHPDQYDVRTKA